MRSNLKFTERASAAIGKAHDAAASLGHSYVGTEHILIGVAAEEGGLGARVLNKNGLDAAVLKELAAFMVGRGAPGEPVQGLTGNARQAVERAGEDAAKLGRGFIGTEHLLIGVLREPDCGAARLLAAAGADVGSIYTDAVALFGGQSFESRQQQSPLKMPSRRTETKILDLYSRDLTELAATGKTDPVIGREGEISRVIQILSRRTKNNPVLVGEPGVGKTAVAEGLAQRVAKGQVPDTLQGHRIVTLDIASMLAGTKYRGDFEDRVKSVLKEVQRAGDIIIFIDELHTIVGAGSAEGAIDASNILKPALGRGELQIIGATTLEEYRRHIEKDAALERRFQPVTVTEPGEETCDKMLRGLRPSLERHHGLRITDGAIAAAVKMSVRYINDRFLPDKAIDLLDEAASHVRMECYLLPGEIGRLEAECKALSARKEAAIAAQNFEQAAQLRDEENKKRGELEKARLAESGAERSLSEKDVAEIVSEWTGVPVATVTEDESKRLLCLEETLHRRVIGQNEAVAAVAKAIRRGRVGLGDPKRPIGSFLFLGPTGVGKTELCRALAEAVYGDESAMIRFDMSEYMEKHAVSKLIGSPPGYVGYDEGGQLTEKVRRRPWSVVLFDEIEKAHEDVWSLLLQVMEDGRLTDSTGRTTDFRNTIIVMTSNVGAKAISDKRPALGFGGTETDEDAVARRAVMAELKKTFRPEFLNRIEDVIVFRRLKREEVKKIASGLTEAVACRMKKLGVTITVTDEAMEKLVDEGFEPASGARPLRRTVRTFLEDPAAEMLLSGVLKAGESVRVTVRDGKIGFSTPTDVCRDNSAGVSPHTTSRFEP
ncbi:MAG: ATP-dependent Clp protease ATP-binding subunit [Clostridia bacterium]|nr:ATP-dependent Clp protease ATP-binding subunit [Clostridia bacterium]